MKTYRKPLASPLGTLQLVATDAALTAVLFDTHDPALWQSATEVSSHPLLDNAATQLTEYFTHRRTSFSLPTALSGTDFQRRVWTALQAIPFGTTWSYAQLATTLGRPTATRAVGAANGKNPLSIIIPCHRVIASDGTLTGYAGGLTNKHWLLTHEQGTE